MPCSRHVLGGIDRIDTHHVGLELLHVGDITGAAGTVRERVGILGVAVVRDGTTGTTSSYTLLIGNALDEELGAVVGIEEFGALDLERGDGCLRGDAESQERESCEILHDDEEEGVKKFKKSYLIAMPSVKELAREESR